MTTRIYIGDALARLREIPDGSVHCCMTSPPYWSLRSYRGEDGMIGLEPTFEEHLENLLAVFDEVWRVLRDDGVCYVNYGDAYASGSKGTGGGEPGCKQLTNAGSRFSPHKPDYGSLKPKNLMFMPFKFAMAMQDRGWIARSRIPWIKKNPMPESMKDRPVNSHEEIFMFVKSNRTQFWTHPSLPGTRAKPEPDHYWFNRQTKAVTDTEPEGWRELVDENDRRIWSRRNRWEGNDYFWDHVSVRTPVKSNNKGGNASWATSAGYQDQDPRYPKRQTPTYGTYKSDGVGRRSESGNHRSKWPPIGKQHAEIRDRNETQEPMQMNEGANMRNYIFASTESFKGAHFATYPTKVIERLIKPGASEHGCCSECGAPFVRITENEYLTHDNWFGDKQAERNSRGSAGESYRQITATRETGWQPTCDCDADVVPTRVLDPFAGAGTTGLVAERLGRDAILVEISKEYAEMAKKRIEDDAPLLSDVRIIG